MPFQFRLRLEDDKLALFALGMCAWEVLGSKMLRELLVVFVVRKCIWVPPLAYVTPEMRSLHVRVELIRAVEVLVAELALWVAAESTHALRAINVRIAVSHVFRELLLGVEFLLDDEHLFVLETEIAHVQAMHGAQVVLEAAHVA